MRKVNVEIKLRWFVFDRNGAVGIKTYDNKAPRKVFAWVCTRTLDIFRLALGHPPREQTSENFMSFFFVFFFTSLCEFYKNIYIYIYLNHIYTDDINYNNDGEETFGSGCKCWLLFQPYTLARILCCRETFVL